MQDLTPEDEPRSRLERAGKRARKLDSHPRLLLMAKLARELLPGDSRFGDPLSVAGQEQAHVVGRRIAALTSERPGVLREAGLSALQVWQALAEAQGRGRGDRELTILFTDLADFSSWAVEAGDDAALELLRDVGQAVEPPVCDRGGRIVKRLGDGLMAVFDEPGPALEAVLEAREKLASVEAPGYVPRLRAGMHVGKPRLLGGDYLGVDVNVAARVAEHAGAGELLVSDRALEQLGENGLPVRRKRFLRAKGLPKDLEVYAISLDAD